MAGDFFIARCGCAIVFGLDAATVIALALRFSSLEEASEEDLETLANALAPAKERA